MVIDQLSFMNFVKVLFFTATIFFLIAAMVLDNMGKNYLKKYVPNVWNSFGWTLKPGFFSVESTDRDSVPHLKYRRWLKSEEAIELKKKHPQFNDLLRLSKISSILMATSFLCWFVMQTSQYIQPFH